mmetsp:Transcript_5021/g.10106  ORF Transcript_5021/g.10106 Transcript_5021/m.10106 type:complete len:510 (-) Transcript_5021:4599-6128(-)
MQRRRNDEIYQHSPHHRPRHPPHFRDDDEDDEDDEDDDKADSRSTSSYSSSFSSSTRSSTSTQIISNINPTHYRNADFLPLLTSTTASRSAPSSSSGRKRQRVSSGGVVHRGKPNLGNFKNSQLQHWEEDAAEYNGVNHTAHARNMHNFAGSSGNNNSKQNSNANANTKSSNHHKNRRRRRGRRRSSGRFSWNSLSRSSPPDHLHHRHHHRPPCDILSIETPDGIPNDILRLPSSSSSHHRSRHLHHHHHHHNSPSEENVNIVGIGHHHPHVAMTDKTIALDPADDLLTRGLLEEVAIHGDSRLARWNKVDNYGHGDNATKEKNGGGLMIPEEMETYKNVGTHHVGIHPGHEDGSKLLRVEEGIMRTEEDDAEDVSSARMSASAGSNSKSIFVDDDASVVVNCGRSVGALSRADEMEALGVEEEDIAVMEGVEEENQNLSPPSVVMLTEDGMRGDAEGERVGGREKIEEEHFNDKQEQGCQEDTDLISYTKKKTAAATTTASIKKEEQN